MADHCALISTHLKEGGPEDPASTKGARSRDIGAIHVYDIND
tara:strand:+ start:1198 stop:1323 length:126 start_codon:yes stop_codon:yes gene_type:complete